MSEQLSSEARDILVKMKGHLSQGWIQGTLIQDNNVCLFGALVKSADLPYGVVCGSKIIKGRDYNPNIASHNIEYGSVAAEAIEAIAKETNRNLLDLALWNDEKERTVDDIVNVIDTILNREKETEVAKVTILICDQCRTEIEGEPWKAQVKKAGQKKMNRGELCDDCVQQFQTILPLKSIYGKMAKPKQLQNEELFSVKV